MSLELTDTDIRSEFDLKFNTKGITFLWLLLKSIVEFFTVSVKFQSYAVNGCYSETSGLFHPIVLAVF